MLNFDFRSKFLRAASFFTLALSAQSLAAAETVPMNSHFNVEIVADDGAVLRANVFLPPAPGRYPVILTQTAYGKDNKFRYSGEDWAGLTSDVPDLCSHSSCDHVPWEAPDPERWVPLGYAVVIVDSRGTGKSPGLLDPLSPRETKDFYEAIEWAGSQSWSNGKVGLLGISYLAMNQWQVASLNPPHLAAIVPWEGATDLYRDVLFHGGIPNNVFVGGWWSAVQQNQNGNATSFFKDEFGNVTTGDPLPSNILVENRVSLAETQSKHQLDDEYYRRVNPALQEIKVPLFAGANWGGLGLHLRGSIAGYVEAGSHEKWLDIHGGSHLSSFYSSEGIAQQAAFFDH